MKIEVHITTKNRSNELITSLNSLYNVVDKSELECVVFDDGSSDNTFELIKEKFPQVRSNRNEVSKGYMYCRNKMLNETNADYVISLDDDATILTKNFIEIIKDYFEKNPRCGVIAMRIFWDENPPKITETKTLSKKVSGFVGCGHVWRKSAWKDLKNYPDWFQFYGEEWLSTMRLFKNNWEVHYVPELFVHHRVNLKKRAVQNKDFKKRYRNAIRADWYVIFLMYPWKEAWKTFFYSLWKQFTGKILKGNFKIILPLALAKFDLIRNSFKIIKERNALTKEQFLAYKKLAPPIIYWDTMNEDKDE